MGYSFIIIGNELEIGKIDKFGAFTPHYHLNFVKDTFKIEQ